MAPAAGGVVVLADAAPPKARCFAAPLPCSLACAELGSVLRCGATGLEPPQEAFPASSSYRCSTCCERSSLDTWSSSGCHGGASSVSPPRIVQIAACRLRWPTRRQNTFGDDNGRGVTHHALRSCTRKRVCAIEAGARAIEPLARGVRAQGEQHARPRAETSTTSGRADEGSASLRRAVEGDGSECRSAHAAGKAAWAAASRALKSARGSAVTSMPPDEVESCSRLSFSRAMRLPTRLAAPLLRRALGCLCPSSTSAASAASITSMHRAAHALPRALRLPIERLSLRPHQSVTPRRGRRCHTGKRITVHRRDGREQQDQSSAAGPSHIIEVRDRVRDGSIRDPSSDRVSNAS